MIERIVGGYDNFVLPFMIGMIVYEYAQRGLKKVPALSYKP